MAFPESIALARHILPERLFKVAARGKTFHDKGFQHLTHCAFCQERYKQFVRQKLKERGIAPPADRSA
jgi:hypothetical protein